MVRYTYWEFFSIFSVFRFLISLKKKKNVQAADPTLINKPITGNKSVLANIVGKKDFDGIMRAKQLFFTQMIMAYHSKKFG